MDNLVLTRVAAFLDRSLDSAVLAELREEPGFRVRLIFLKGESGRSVLIALAPGRSWIGRPATRRSRRPPTPGKFVSASARALKGLVLERVGKPPADRTVTFRFADGHRLVAELNPRAPNLVLVDPTGAVAGSMRRPRSARARVTAGRPYLPPELPTDRLDPFDADPDGIEAAIERFDSPREALRRGFVGIGREAIDLVVRESAGRSIGQVLAGRLAQVRSGEVDPVILAPEEPLKAAERGDLDPSRCRLLPWPPDRDPEPPLKRIERGDPSSTAGLFHEAIDRVEQDRRLARELSSVLEREIRRVERAEAAARADLTGFEDPDRYRRQGEALLAGLGVARRAGSRVLVADPYDPKAGDLVIEATPGKSLTQVAEELFTRHRRSLRGLEQARERIARLGDRRGRLETIRRRCATGEPGPGSTQELLKAMQGERIPVGLQRPSRRERTAVRPGRSRLEGVRIFSSRDGETILVGKSGRDNDRLTFKIAGPEDFWLHADGAAGAHVVLRNEGRRSRPSRAALEDAAAAAAWFSEARADGMVDVRWTRRKYVRRARGAARGAVLLKKFETVRVRARRPATPEELR